MNEQQLQARKDFSRTGFALLAMGITVVILQILLGFLVLEGTPIGDAEWMIWLLTFAPMYLVAMPVGIALLKRIPTDPHPKEKIGIKRFFVLFLMCMPIMYGGNIIGTVLSSLLSGGTAENALMDYVMGNPLYSILVMVILAPVLEEYIFRKLLIDRLSKYGELTAMLFSATVFGLFHMNFFQFFYAFGLGLLFAYIYTRTRNLLYPVLLHMIINFQGSVLAPWLLSSVDLELITAPESGAAATEDILGILPGLLAYTLYSNALLAAVIAGLVLLIVNWKKRQILPAAPELPFRPACKAAYINWGMVLFTLFCLVMIVLALF